MVLIWDAKGLGGFSERKILEFWHPVKIVSRNISAYSCEAYFMLSASYWINLQHMTSVVFSFWRMFCSLKFPSLSTIFSDFIICVDDNSHNKTSTYVKNRGKLHGSGTSSRISVMTMLLYFGKIERTGACVGQNLSIISQVPWGLSCTQMVSITYSVQFILKSNSVLACWHCCTF